MMKNTIIKIMAVTMTAAIMSSCASKPESPATTDTPPATQAESVTEEKAEETKKDDTPPIDIFADLKLSFDGEEYQYCWLNAVEYTGNDDKLTSLKYSCVTNGGNELSVMFNNNEDEVVCNGDTATLKLTYIYDGTEYKGEKDIVIDGLIDRIENIEESPDIRAEIDSAFEEKVNEKVSEYYAVDDVISSEFYINGNKDDKWKITSIDITPEKAFWGYWADKNPGQYDFSMYTVMYAVNLNVEKTETTDSEGNDGYSVGDTTTFTVYAGCYTEGITNQGDYRSYYAMDFFPTYKDGGKTTYADMSFEDMCNELNRSDFNYHDNIHEIT